MVVSWVVSHTRSMHTSPPSTAPPLDHPPRRSTSDRWVGGVSTATAGYLGISRNVARLLYVLATAVGGIGIVVYIVVWLFLPDDQGRVLVKGDGGRSGEPLWASLSAALAALIVTAWVTRNGPDLLVAVLVGAGVFVLTQRGGSAPAEQPGAGGAGPSVAPPPYEPDVDTTVMPAPTPADAVAPDVTATLPSDTGTLPSDTGTTETTVVEPVTGVLPSIEGTTAVLPRTVPSRRTTLAPERPPRPPKPPRPPAFLGPLTVSIAVAVCGAMALLFATGVWDLRLSDILITALVIIGLGLLVSTWYGRARGLVLLGLLLVPVVLTSALLDRVDLSGGIGDRHIAPATAEELMGEYRFGVGSLTLDLRELDTASVDGPLRSSLSAGAGLVQVYVPADWTVDIPVTVGIGEVDLRVRDTYGGEGDPPPEWSQWADSPDTYRRTDVPVDSSALARSDGAPVHTVRARGAEGAPTLELDVDLSIGLVEVFRVAA